jgi:hypothetical protein
LKKTGIKVGDAVSEALRTMEESEIMRAVRSYLQFGVCIMAEPIASRFLELPQLFLQPLRNLQSLYARLLRIRPCQKLWLTLWTTVVVRNMLGLRKRKLVVFDGKSGSRRQAGSLAWDPNASLPIQSSSFIPSRLLTLTPPQSW